ncbi:anti-sigma factor [Halalkalibacter okhensis]|uniref:Sigma factor regulator C-terminal domain-containing protein n=1 Tax=Halalkalibacter okhensis TaxID=333138 RepID=A0A0B0IEG6_9BACI|nr:anti sigma factor C-terminal domain-containing protein [Halalkalibacter okhensis]KHF39262.1 hypothetical protein LQ50_16285 [Halalkalibacter okhensis]
MDCNEVKSKWKSYMNGECREKDEKEIEEHLQGCSQCELLLNQDIEKQEENHLHVGDRLNDQERLLDDIPIKKQKKWLRKAKWKNRLMNALTIFMLFIGVSIISGILTAFFFGFGTDEGRGEKAIQVIRTATQMTMPNVYLAGGGMNTNFYYTMDIDFQIQKQLGREHKSIGQLHGKMFFNLLNVNREWTDGQYDVKLYFMHPQFVENQPETEQTFYQETLQDTWNTLDLLPKGTVSELAITFDQLYDIDDVYALLHDYDLDIVWYAIDTGTEGKGDTYHSPYLSANSDIWGFHEHAIFDFSRDGGSIRIRGDGHKRAEAFKTGLQFLAENKKLVERYIWYFNNETSIEDRYNYVEENGVKTYGVVVTGPTKELLTLQENNSIIFATLGEVDFWNWYDRPAGGTIYN